MDSKKEIGIITITMENDKLKKAYEAVEMLKALDLPVSKEQLNAIAELESERIQNEITPRLKRLLKPMVENLGTSFRIEISYSPDDGLRINNLGGKRPYRRSNNANETKGERKRRSKASVLKVTFPNGRVISHNKASQTLLDVVDYIGFKRVEQLKWKVSSQPFVSREVYPRDQQERDGWYVTTHSGTVVKKQQIEKLSELFHLNLIVELV